jgi:peptide/nickel transport system substrate-binding protein
MSLLLGGCRTGTRRLKAAIAITFALGVGAAVGGCGSSATSGSTGADHGSEAGGTLRIWLSTAETFDPATVSYSGEYETIMMDLVYAPLIHATTEGKYEPALATSWHYVKGSAEPNTVFELTLRKGAKFSDGTPVSASAVSKWLNYFVKAAGPFHESFGKNPKFEAMNAQTVRITLSEPNPSVPFLLSDAGTNAGWVVSPKGIANPKQLETEPDGAGPYVLEPSQTVQESKYVFTRNPDYFAPADIAFQKAEVKVISEGSSRLQAQQSGQLDVAQGEPATVSAAEGAGLEVLQAPNTVPFLQFDLLHNPPAPIKDIRVRRAINLAIDRDAIATGIYGESASPTSSLLPSDVDTSKLVNYWEYNPTKAKEELAAAGYSDGFTLHTLTEGAYGGLGGEPIVQAVAKNLEEVGIKLEIEASHNVAEFGEAIFSYEYPFLKINFGLVPTPSIYATLFAPQAPANFIGTDPEMKHLYEEGVRAENPESDFLKMWKRYSSQAYSAPLVAENFSVYVGGNVTGVAMSAKRSAPLPTEWRSK